MPTFDYNDIRKHDVCISRGHDLRRVGETDYYNCKCGASARVKDGRIELDNGSPQSYEEKVAAAAGRKRKHLERA